MSNSKKRITLGVATLGCLLIAAATAGLKTEAAAEHATVTPLAVASPAGGEESLPLCAEQSASERKAEAQDLAETAETPQTESSVETEELSYSYKISQEVERSTLETSGVLTMTLERSSEKEQRAEARLLSVVAWQSEGVDTVFLSEVMASTADVTLSPVGAITEIKLPEGLSSEAARYWKRILGRWQTAGPAKPKYAKRWRASERNELGTYSALYEPDAERSDGRVRKIVLGYKSVDDPHLPGPPMIEGEILISPGEHPSSIEGQEVVRIGLNRMGIEERITFSFTRTS
jgi:hypothetical protein